jgi:hypothetical protein
LSRRLWLRVNRKFWQDYPAKSGEKTGWKSKWFYITNHHPELTKPSGKQPKHRPWWNTEPTMQEGIQLPELLLKIKALREVGLNK